ncbi:PLP-dependent aminotransferase family protein [Tardiphaga sp. 866_E4_N2_1]|uniref:aminotransferase-like domain-containing protein n=1 Tax=unclassified Tardiphaga TaxID=2631404 RepID=UPI003F25FA90
MNWRPNIGHSSKPKYLALVEALENDIASGALKHGDRLPPQREIAGQLDITIATITKAIREAARRGIVTARTGSGTFIRIGESLPEADRPVPDLSLNTVPSGPAKPFLDAALEHMGGKHASELLLSYEPSVGSEHHRASMAKWLRKRKLSVQPSQILLTHGGQHALAACFHALTRPGDTVLCEEWTYSGIRRLADLCHVRIEGVEMDAEGLKPASLRDQLKKTGAKLAFCTAVVQNPTTATMSLARRREILSICKKADALVVEDDIYGVLSGEELPALAAIDSSQTIHVSSLSKCLSPGIRLGALVAPEQLVPGLQNALVSLQWTAPTFWAEMFEFMRENGMAERCLAAHRKEAGRRLELYQDIVEQKPGTSLPSYHVWQKVPSPWRLDDFVSQLHAVGVRVSPAAHFAVSPQSDNNFIRISLGGGDDIDLLKTQLMKVKEVMRGRPRLSATII